MTTRLLRLLAAGAAPAALAAVLALRPGPASPDAAPAGAWPAAAPDRDRAVARTQKDPDPWPDNTPYDGTFKFARIRYETGGGGGFRRGFGGEPPWHHDYPYAERNLGSILAEMSYVRAYREGGNVFRLGDPELFRYPVAILSEPGFWQPDENEMEALRTYLGKGGFIIFDDFTGARDMRNLMAQMQRAVPGAQPILLEVDAPIFQSFFQIETLEMMHPYRGVPSQFFGFFADNDPAGRMLAIANYNNDLGELWEFSAEGFFPVDMTNEAYKFGVNYVLYTLTR